MTTETQRLHDALVAASGAAVPGAAAPEPGKLWAAVHGELPSREAMAVIDAALLDPAAYEELRLALALRQELQAAPEPVVGSRARVRLRWLTVPLALAAALVGVLTLQPRTDFGDTAPAPSYRGGETSAIESQLAPGVALPREGFVLRWSDAGDDARYTVSVSTDEPRLLLNERGLTQTELRVPPEGLAGLPAGAAVLWRVQVERPDGSRERSRTFTTKIR